MNKKKLEQFFKNISKRLKYPAEFYLTGGVAAWFLGNSRPTEDLDFALKCKTNWEEISKELQLVSKNDQIPIEFSEDISRWGMVGYSDFTKGAKLIRQYPKLKIYLLDPVIWSVGKMNRFTENDVRDILKVFRKQKVSFHKVIKIWSEALKNSPKSSEQILFIKKVEAFFKKEGHKIWAKNFDEKKAFMDFRKKVMGFF
ncbi:MAG: hypothetical protein HQM15_04075 [Deltaproteobacteria bacterium]|nr:hypothetical protein [Deltaproteobacteria bacterium]